MKHKAKSLISVNDLTKDEILSIFEKVYFYKKALTQGKFTNTLEHKTILQVFLEKSTRTQISFQQAARLCGAKVITFRPESSSMNKGETLDDTINTLIQMPTDALVIRHQSAGVPFRIASEFDVPVINAGDGFHEHPTQALLDYLTIGEALNRLENLKILIIGDIAHSRVARSHINLAKIFGNKISVCAPPTLLPPNIEKTVEDVYTNLDQALEGKDLVICLRIQQERHEGAYIPSLREYAKFWRLDLRHVERHEKLFFMHPGPSLRGVDIDSRLSNHPRSLIDKQVKNSVPVRASILEKLLEFRGKHE